MDLLAVLDVVSQAVVPVQAPAVALVFFGHLNPVSPVRDYTRIHVLQFQLVQIVCLRLGCCHPHYEQQCQRTGNLSWNL